MRTCLLGLILAVLPWCAYADQEPSGLAVTLGPAYEFAMWAGPRAMLKDGDGGGFSVVSPYGNAVECFDAAMKKPKRYEFSSQKGKYIETLVVNPDDVRSVNITRKRRWFHPGPHGH